MVDPSENYAYCLDTCPECGKQCKLHVRHMGNHECSKGDKW